MGKMILGAVLLSLFSAVPLNFLQSRGFVWTARILMFSALLASIYCVTAGIYLMEGWGDLFIDASGAELGNASARGRGRGGIIIAAIRYWPWVLIVGGSYLGYMQIHIVHGMLKDHT